MEPASIPAIYKGKKLVVILGAGASADFGVPTLAGLFKDKYARTYLTENSWLFNHLNEIFWKPRGHDLSTSEESLSIEEMLTVLRDWESEKTVTPGLCGDDIKRFRRALYILIERALFVAKSSNKEHLNPLLKFARGNFAHTTWASFNWDCIFESSFWYESGPPGAGNRNNPSLVIPISNWRDGTSRHHFLKLHGGINWWMINGKLTYLPFSGGGDLQSQWVKYKDNESLPDQPVILEPSYYKYQDETYKILEPQWTEFLKRLVEADLVLVIGYSLPSADSQARSKMMTGFQANQESRWGIIDPNKEVCSRYKRLFGRKRLGVYEGGLVGFNNSFADNFHQLFSEEKRFAG